MNKSLFGKELRMKTFLLTIFTIIGTCQFQAQVITKAGNSFVIVDWLDKVVVSFHEDQVGKMYVWSTERVPHLKNLRDKFVLENDTLCCVQQGVRTYFVQDNLEIKLIGYESNQYKVHYSIPETYLQFPMFCGSVFEGEFKGVGSYCDKMQFTYMGHFKTNLEKYGCIVQESGDTIHNVRMIHTIRKNQLVTNEKQDSSSYFYEEESRWYADGFRYPVMVSRTISAKELPQKLAGQAYLYIFQEYEKASAYGSLLKETDIVQKAKTIKMQDFCYEAKLDGSTINVAYKLNRKATLYALLTDSKGCLYKTVTQPSPPGETCSFKMDCSMLPRGQYVLFLNVNNNRTSKNFFINNK